MPPGRLLLQTIRSHDQYNTTIYGLNDRYRGIKPAAGSCSSTPTTSPRSASPTARPSTSSPSGSDEERRAERFRVVAYPTARGCAAAYYPETNALVPLDSTADVSNTPTSKSVVIRLEPVERTIARQRRGRPAGDAARSGRTDAHAVGAGQVRATGARRATSPTAPGRCRARRRGPPGRASAATTIRGARGRPRTRLRSHRLGPSA